LKFITESDSEIEPPLKISSRESILNMCLYHSYHEMRKNENSERENYSKIIIRYKYIWYL